MTEMLIAGRYKVVSIIGEGGTAIVYKARCTVLDRIVAVKMLKPEFCKDDSFLQRFNHEARAAAALSHQNIVGIFDIGISENVPFIVMEYVDGKDLKTIIKENGKLPESKVGQIAVQLLSALEYAHARGIVHRDIKPHNILLTQEGIVKVADFGIAKAVTEATLVHTGVVIGTVHYLSPEQAKGGLIDARTDIYSTGILLYELLSGKLPFDGDNPISIALMHIRDNPPALHTLEPNLPAKWDFVIMKALAKDAEDRFAGAKEMRNAINSSSIDRLLQDKSDKINRAAMEKTVEIEKSKLVTSNEHPPRPKQNKFKLTPKFFIIIGIILILAMSYLVLRTYLDVPETKVPLVVGLTVSAAEEALVEQSLKMNVQREINDENALPGTVVFQEIPAGTNVKSGTTINVVISARDGKMTMPDLTGMTKENALKSIEKAELRQGKITEGFSDTVEKGKVIEQSPLPDSIVYAGDKVDLVISKGVTPADMPMPEVVGLNVTNAKSVLSQYNLSITQVLEDYDPTAQKGQIIRQEPAAGDVIAEGSGIKVWVHSDKAGGSKNIRITVPTGLSGAQTVRAVLNDQRGSSEVYRVDHSSGDSITIPVTWVGDGASVSVYVGGALQETIPLAE